jgi:hypothetical protein
VGIACWAPAPCFRVVDRAPARACDVQLGRRCAVRADVWGSRDAELQRDASGVDVSQTGDSFARIL